jgi:hypothetical protein
MKLVKYDGGFFLLYGTASLLPFLGIFVGLFAIPLLTISVPIALAVLTLRMNAETSKHVQYFYHVISLRVLDGHPFAFA